MRKNKLIFIVRYIGYLYGILYPSENYFKNCLNLKTDNKWLMWVSYSAFSFFLKSAEDHNLKSLKHWRFHKSVQRDSYGMRK